MYIGQEPLFPFTVRLVFLPVRFHAHGQLLLLQVNVKLLRNRHKSANLQAELPPRPLAKVFPIGNHRLVVKLMFVKKVGQFLDHALG